MLISVENFPLLDLYMEISNEINIKTYENMIAEFVELWGVDIHIFCDKLSGFNGLEELLEILEKTRINTFSFNIGFFNTKFEYESFETIGLCAKHKVNSLVIPIKKDLIELKKYINYIENLNKRIKLEVYLKLDRNSSVYLDEIVDFCICKKVRICILDIDKKAPEGLKISKNEYGELLKKVFQINSDKKIRISLAECPYLNAIDKKRFDDTLGGCAGGLTSCFIKSNGDITPCIYLSDVVVGNIRNDSLKNIWKESQLLLKLRNRLNIKGRCGKCSYLMSCGGCRGEAYWKTNDLFAEDYNCWIEEAKDERTY